MWHRAVTKLKLSKCPGCLSSEYYWDISCSKFKACQTCYVISSLHEILARNCLIHMVTLGSYTSLGKNNPKLSRGQVSYKCSQHSFTYIRGWMQMVLAPNDLFSWNNNTMSYILVMDMLHYCCPMHNDTYSVHNRSLKPWWSHLSCLQSFCYVFSPPLSGLNWTQLSLFGGPGPPSPKMASPLLGSLHTPFPGSGTISETIFSSYKVVSI